MRMERDFFDMILILLCGIAIGAMLVYGIDNPDQRELRSYREGVILP